MRSDQNKQKSNSNPRRSRRRPNPNAQSKQTNQKNHRHSSNRNQQQSRKRHSKWNRHRISEHFSKRDFDSRRKDCTSCSSSLRISLGLVGVIEALRSQLKKRIEIVTGFYCSDCRDRQYGIKRDYHHAGVAADIRVADMDLVELFLTAESYPEIKGLGINFDSNHVHIDTRKEDVRQTWVEINEEWILLTDENRNEYIKQPVTTNDTPDTDS